MGKNSNYEDMKKKYQALGKMLTKGVTEKRIINFVEKNRDYFDVRANDYLDILYKSGTVEITDKGLIKKVA